MTGFFSTEPFLILEYQTIDSLGRGKEWLFAGIARTQAEVAERRQEIELKLKGRDYKMRQHQYSHGFGAMEKVLDNS